MNMDNAGVFVSRRFVIPLAKVNRAMWVNVENAEVVDKTVADALVVMMDGDRISDSLDDDPVLLDKANGDADAFISALSTYWETRS